MVDITERKRKEEALAALAESKSQSQAIGESIAYGIWICEPDGGLRYASRSFLDLIGMTMEEASRFGWTRALAPDAVEPMLLAWEACRTAGGQWEYEHVVRAAGGPWHTLLSRGHPIRDGEGQITSWAGINLDITERKEAEGLREAFIGVLSHELRTPITSIYGASKLLRRTSIDGPERDDLVTDIGHEAERLRHLVEDLLVLARVERGGLQVDTEPVLLPHLVPRVVADERRRWDGPRFEVSISESLPIACGDETLIEQVLRNLLSNAVKYGPADGRIDVVVDEAGGKPRIRVLDEGPGIDPGEADRLFDLFYRSPRTSDVAGSGIGLFVARRLVEAMGGQVWARERQDGRGSEFGVDLQPFRDDAL
jgi:PAS domain S-box-containing protein